MKIEFSDLSFFNKIVKTEVEDKLLELISNSRFIGGKEKLEFEKNFAKYTQTKHCIGVGNCTDGLEIAIKALSLKRQSEVIVPSNSFIASSEAVTNNQLKVVFADCDPQNYTISLESIKRKITKKTSAIVVVHLYGHPANMDGIKELVKEKNIKIIEDCAQAHGAKYNNNKVGSIGDVGVFSFYPGKNLGAFGDAGCIVTNSSSLAKKCKMISNHGRLDKYNHEFEGRNSRLDNIQAAILDIKLRYLDKINSLRIENAKIYFDQLSGIDQLILPKQESWAFCIYHQFVVRVSNRDNLKSFLSNNGVETGIHYPIALPKLNAYKHLKTDYSSFFSFKNDSNILSLPVSEHLKRDEILYTTNLIKKFYNA
jgi:dTDP-4-amino-4,6-dideoxygalactose transaminase